MRNHEIESIYKPPQTPVAYPAEDNSDFVIAGKWRRFFNYLIDYAAMVTLGIALGTPLALLLGKDALEPIWNLPDFVFSLLLTLIYYLPFELLTGGRTIGKFITGTKVVNEDGEKPSTGQVFARTFSRMVPFEPFSFLGVMGRGWHDTWSKTYVIECR